MTLPFRRRHNDAESAHDRARAFMSEGFIGALSEDEAAWLADHLLRCPECQTERDAYLADHLLLQGLRDRMPEPPRDLWARTAAAIEAEARPQRGRRAGIGQILQPPRAGGPRGLPLGVIAGALVVFVVVGTALLPRAGRPIVRPSNPGFSAVAVATSPGSTPFQPEANRVAWVQRAADGSFSLVFADIDHACPAADPTCAPLADSSPAPLALAAAPQAVILSPSKTQIAVVGTVAQGGGSVLIVDVPGPHPTASPASPTGTGIPRTPAPTSSVATSPSGSASPTPGAAQREIISGVTVVGSAGFSGDGQWLAFSARPTDGAGGPNLYLWHVGDAQARQVTTDGETFFSGWYGGLVLASGIVAEPASPTGSPAPGTSLEPSETSTPVPPPTAGAGSPAASPEASAEASATSSPEASPSVAAPEAHPYSFVLDPTTGARSAFALPDVWLPSIDPTGRFVTYWSGTVTPADATAQLSSLGQVSAWRPATGHLVLDGWTAGLTPPPSPSVNPSAAASGESSSSPEPTAEPSAELRSREPASPSPAAGSASPSDVPSSPIPGVTVGPSGTPIELAAGPIADFEAHFDPSGMRLAIWVLDAPESSAGRLWLVVLDPVVGAINADLQPMAAPGVQALRGYTIDTGRLAWATPAGQDGQPSSVQVLAWKGDDFGQVQSVPGGNPQIVR